MIVLTTAPLLKPEALEWVNDVAQLSIATDFRLRELHGEAGSFL